MNQATHTIESLRQRVRAVADTKTRLSQPTATCPCCGSNVARGQLPIVDLNTNSLVVGDTRVHLTPQKAEIMTALIERWPGIASYDYLIGRVWGVTEPEKPRIILKVLKCSLCRTLRNLGYDIKVVPDTGMRLERVGT